MKKRAQVDEQLSDGDNKTIKDPALVGRLNEFLKYKGIRSIKEFEDRCDLGDSVRNFTERSQIQKVRKIRTAFPELNVWWLFFGDGEMLQYQTEEGNNNCFNVHSHGGTNNTTGLMITQTSPEKLEDIEKKLASIELLSARVGILDGNLLSMSTELKKYQKENASLLKLLEQSQNRCDKLTDELIRLKTSE